MIRKIIGKLKKIYRTSSNSRFVKYLREEVGIEIGERVDFRDPHTTNIDMTRPCLVSIGDDVDINVNFSILTHDWCSFVFRNLYHDFINSSGEVRIGNNVYIGANVTILKGVTVGDNCIIGAGSVVNRSIPAGSVAVGVPCKVVSTTEAYYRKRQTQALEEAKDYVRCFRKRHGRDPKASELWEEFIWFVDKRNINEYPEIPVRQQLGEGFDDWLARHEAPYASLADFLSSIDN